MIGILVVNEFEDDRQRGVDQPPTPKKFSNAANWTLTKEKILFALGVILVIFEFVNAELLDRPFHIEFLIAALALCGVSIAQWGDKK